MDLNFVFDESDYDLLDAFREEHSATSPMDAGSTDEEAVDELIRNIPNSADRSVTSCSTVSPQGLSDPDFARNSSNIYVQQYTKPLVLLPATSADAIMTNATATLRATGLQFMNEPGTAFQSLEEFRETFYGGIEDAAGGGNSFDLGDEDDFDEEDSTNGHSKAASKPKKRKRGPAKRPSNPDAELIMSATDEQMHLLGIDPNSREGKQQRRRIRNRMSAQLHRERKAMYIDALEAFVRLKELRIRELEKRVSGMPLSGLTEQRVDKASSSARSGSVVNVCGGGSTTGESSNSSSSDTESLSSSSCPGSPYVTEAADALDALLDDLEEPILPPSKLKRAANTGTGVNGGTGIRGGSNGIRHLLPFLAVVCMVALCFSGDTLSLSSSMLISSLAAPAYSQLELDMSGSHHRRELHEITTLDDAAAQPMGSAIVAAQATWHHASSNFPSVRVRNGKNFDASTDITAQQDSTSSSRSHSHGSRSSGSVDNSLALWRYSREDLIANLYPRTRVEFSDFIAEGKRSSAVDIDSQRRKGKARHLRSRETAEAEASNRDIEVSSASPARVVRLTSHDPPMPFVNAAEASSYPGSVSDHSSALIPLHSGGAQSGSAASAAPAFQSQSRVLMETGKALLDPSMTLTRTVRIPHGVLPSIGAVPGASGLTDVNHLVMLLPTSSVRWGKAWGDSGSTASLLAGLRLADELANENSGLGADSRSADQSVPAEEDNMFVEIVCTVYSAQLVKNATLM